MSIVRTIKRENPFVQLDKAFIGNGKLSLKATGLLTYILSRPDGWQIRMKDIQNRFNDGETSVRSAMKELISEGYVNRYRERGEGGKFGDWIYDVYERPEYNPNPMITPKRENQVLEPKRDFPDLDNPEQENHGYSNNDFSNNDFSNKKEEEEEDNHLASLISTFKNLIANSNSLVESKLKHWLTILPYEVIKAEIEHCALSGAKSWNYIEKALIDDKNKGISNVIELESKRSNFSTTKKGYATNKKKTIRKEPTPDELFERQIEENKGKEYTQEEIKALEERLKRRINS